MGFGAETLGSLASRGWVGFVGAAWEGKAMESEDAKSSHYYEVSEYLPTYQVSLALK